MRRRKKDEAVEWQAERDNEKQIIEAKTQFHFFFKAFLQRDRNDNDLAADSSLYLTLIVFQPKPHKNMAKDSFLLSRLFLGRVQK